MSPQPTDLEQELGAARDAAIRAGEMQIRERPDPLDVEFKSDRSPVTPVDTRSESLIRDALLAAFPGDGFLGEETGELPGKSGRTWIVDPLDGTRPYLRGIPTHSVLIGLEDDTGVSVGVVHLPALNETYWATRDEGAFCNGRPIHVSDTTRISSAMASCLGYIESAETAEGARLLALMRNLDYMYGFMDAYSYMCVAAGRLDLCISTLDSAWDRAAPACIVREAGGKYSDFAGSETIHSRELLLTNSHLHQYVLGRLRSTR